jgi:hypothetical protein
MTPVIPSDQPDSNSPSPLVMSVHSMPRPAGDAKSTPSGGWKLLLLVMASLAPAILAYVYVFAVRPQGSAAIGELIHPPRPLPDLAAVAVDGKPYNQVPLRGQWLLVSVGSGACDRACDRRLFLQRQLHESLGKDKSRLDRVWLLTDSTAVEPRLAASLQGVTVLRAPADRVSAWLQASQGHALNDHLYLVDPMGNWMMRFPPNPDLGAATKIKRDLAKLLAATQSWQAPARPTP